MDQSISSSTSQRHCWTVSDIQNEIEQSRIVVFSRGSKCGYCDRVINLLSDLGLDYKVVDINEETTIKPALRSFSGHREVPLIYVNGHLVDSLQQLVESGTLEAQLRDALDE